MKLKMTLASALGCAALVLSLSVAAGQPPNSNIEYVHPDNLGKPLNFMPGSTPAYVRQRLDYGQGYRYGRIVDGPMGHIIIWDVVPNRIPGSNPIMSPKPVPNPGTTNIFGPKLQYKPEYGKTSKRGY